MLDDMRAAQVFVENAGSGSGYAVSAQLILTARHVLHKEGAAHPALGDRAEVRLFGDPREKASWLNASLRWYDPDRDVALLLVGENEAERSPTLKNIVEGSASVTIGELPEDGDFDDCRTFGWPRIMDRDKKRDPMPFRGKAIARGRHADELICAIATDLTPKQDLGWEGMSGAGLRIDDTLVGIVTEVDDRFQEGTLWVLPLAAIPPQSEFWQITGAARPLQLRGKLPGGLRPRYVAAPALYVPRPELTDALLTFLLEPSSTKAPIAVISGMGGLGKTTTADWIASHPAVRQKFYDGQLKVTLGTEKLDDERLRAIRVDWINALRSARDLEVQPNKEGAQFDLEERLADRKALFVIDDVWPASSEAAGNLVSDAPGCAYLITTRFADPWPCLPQMRNRVVLGRAYKIFDLEPLSEAQGRELVEKILERPLNQDEAAAASRLITIVGGHPLALELIAGRTKEGSLLTQLAESLSEDTASLKQMEWQENDFLGSPEISVEAQRSESVRISLLFSINLLPGYGRRYFAEMGVLAKDFVLSPAAAATLWSIDAVKAASELRKFANFRLLHPSGQNRESEGYRLHHLLHDVARELLAASADPSWLTRKLTELPAPAEDQMKAAMAEGSQRLLKRYRAKTRADLWHTLVDDGYIFDHLLWHFEQAGQLEEIEKLLWEETPDGHCGWYEARQRLGETTGFLADVSQAWRNADKTLLSATNEEESGRAIAQQLHCALIAASFKSLSASIPCQVLSGAVRCELITVPNALALARQCPTPDERFRALLAVADAASAKVRSLVIDEAVRAARGIKDPLSGVPALAAVAQYLSEEEKRNLLMEAQDLARQTSDLATQAVLIAGLARYLPRDDRLAALGEALSAARGGGASPSAAALVAVADELPLEEQIHVLEEALYVARGVESTWERPRALALVAERLPPGEQSRVIHEALGVARSIPVDGFAAFFRDRALSQVAWLLPSEEALSVAAEIEHARCRADLLVAVAARLPPDEALVVARRIDLPVCRDLSLFQATSRLCIEEALSVAREIGDAQIRAATLAKVAERLPTDGQSAVLREALSAALCIGDSAWQSSALAQVAEWLPAEEHLQMRCAALSTARGINDAGARAAALAKLAGRCKDQAGLITEALSSAQAIAVISKRDEALRQVAAQLPAKEALAIAGDIDDEWNRARVVEEAALRLSPRAGLEIARNSNNFEWRAGALASIAARLPQEQRAGVLDEALISAFKIDEECFRDEALGTVAKRLPPLMAVRVAGQICDSKIRAETLVAIAQGLPTELNLVAAISEAQKRLPSEMGSGLLTASFLLMAGSACILDWALTEAETLIEPCWRAEALSKVANALPAEERRRVLDRALSVAMNIDDVVLRVRTLAVIAERLPAKEQASVLTEALSASRSIDDPERRSEALSTFAQPWNEELAGELAKAMSIAPAGTSPHSQRKRAEVLAQVAERLAANQITQSLTLLWEETLRALALRKRFECGEDLCSLLQFVNALGGCQAVRALGRSIAAVGRWWP